MKKAIYPGSFDMFTEGHLLILKKAAKLFDEVVVAIAVNPNKKRRYDENAMKTAIEETIIQNQIKNASVVISKGMVVRYAEQIGAGHIVRGFRNEMDIAYEERITVVNQKLNAEIETIYFNAGELGYISSSAVVELMKYGEDVSSWVPAPVYELVYTDGEANK